MESADLVPVVDNVLVIPLDLVPGFRGWGSGFRLQVSGFRLRITGFGFLVSGFGFFGFGFRVSGFWFRVSGFGLRVSGVGLWGSGSGFRVLGVGEPEAVLKPAVRICPVVARDPEEVEHLQGSIGR